jgi:hypothetical protein
MPRPGSVESALLGSTAAADTAAGQVADTTTLESAPGDMAAGVARKDVAGVPARAEDTTREARVAHTAEPRCGRSFCGAPVSN